MIMEKVIIIAGPTASGKSQIALQLAKEINGEIINADSVQVYRYFDIGSAKPAESEKKSIPHHLIDIVNPDEEFNAYRFKELAREKVQEIFKRGKIPIIVGGTGLYIRCFLFDLFTQDESLIKRERQIIDEELKGKGLESLYNELKEVDPKSSEKIHPNDFIRITRALEFYRAYKIPLSAIHEKFNFSKSFCDYKIIVPLWEKSSLLKRIIRRTEEIFQKGIADEVKKILSMGYSRDVKPFKSIGYREALELIDGKLRQTEAIEKTINQTKKYAKRQLVWFKKEKNTCFFGISEKNFDNIIFHIKKILEIV